MTVISHIPNAASIVLTRSKQTVQIYRNHLIVLYVSLIIYSPFWFNCNVGFHDAFVTTGELKTCYDAARDGRIALWRVFLHQPIGLHLQSPFLSTA